MLQKKVCMLGSFAVGKTSLVRRFVESIFDESYLTTILNFIGLTDVTVVRAEGLAFGPEAREAALLKARERIAAIAA